MRIGILGAARIAPAAVIHPARALAGVEVVCIGARSLAGAQAFAAEHGIPAAHQGYRAAIIRQQAALDRICAQFATPA